MKIPELKIYLAGRYECSIDIWGEAYCSMNSRFRPIIGDRLLETMANQYLCFHALKRMSNGPSTFAYVRKLIENQPWTLTEMSKALKWIFNGTELHRKAAKNR